MIEIKDITKKYDDIVLNHVSYRFEKNKIYVIKGVSGCGKSTLLNILGGIEGNYQGEYLFEGKDVRELSKKQREELKQSYGYIFQSSLLISGLTIMENLLFICDDRDSIERYAKQLNVEELLDKYPEQLSGGERQRISVIRAMIMNPAVILADEPTASLDRVNSLEVAKLFEMLKSANRVIIIATHENCFDDVADEIIKLDYGEIGEIQKKGCEVNAKKVSDESNEETKHYNSLRMLLPLIFKRQRKKYRISALVPMTLVIFAVLLCFSAQHNFYTESVNYCMNQYPMEVIPVMDNIYDMNLSLKYDNVQKFSLYTIQEKGYLCYPLLDEKDSVLAYGDLIKYGTFPEADDEVLISHKMAIYLKDEDNIQDCLGEKIVIQEREYKITGVIADINNDYTIDKAVYYGDVYYREVANARVVYMPYQTISKCGEVQETDYYMVKIDGLYEDEELYEYVKERVVGGTISEWDNKLTEMKNMSNYVNKIISVTFILAAFMAMLFIKNEIEVDLFYRRKELGYLQIFGVRKKTMWLQLILERMAKNTVCLLVAIVLFNVIAIIVKIAIGINIFVTLIHILALLGIVLTFSLISVILPIRNFMKKSVLQLITE